MPRLLLITDNFPPDFAPRMGNLCKHLATLGWGIDVFCEDNDSYKLCEMDIDLSRVHVQRIKYYRTKGRLEYGIKYLLNILYPHKDRSMFRDVRSLLRKGEYECVLAASYHIFPLRCAECIARELDLPLYVDLRDITEQYGQPTTLSSKLTWRLKGWYLHRKRRNKILQGAQGVSTVSPWHVETLSKYNKNTHLIYNGYDTEVFSPRDVKSDTFSIVYTGRLLSIAQQDPIAFFEAMKSIAQREEGRDMMVNWHTDKDSEIAIRELAKAYHIEHMCTYHEMQSLDRIPTILRESSIALVVVNKINANSAHGIMTTKFFEALGVEKPVLCVPNDEDCLERAIKETNAGIASGKAEEIEAFILEKYAEWKAQGYTRQAVIEAEKVRFTRQHQATQFIELMRSEE